MTNQTDAFSTQHTAHAFDNDLAHLHSQLLVMLDLISHQLDHALHALSNGNVTQAGKVIARNKKVKDLEIKIDNIVMTVIARRSPVANDLRAIIASSKIVAELEKMGDEIADFAQLVLVLFDPNTSDPNQNLLKDVLKIGQVLSLMLAQLRIVIDNKSSTQAYALLQRDQDCEVEFQHGIEHQLILVAQNLRMIGRALDIMQMMKALERCSELCINIAEYLIFMLDGVDLRHTQRKNDA